jgi:hypothetical protein
VEPAISAINTATTRRSPSVPAICAVWHRPGGQPGERHAEVTNLRGGGPF